MSKQATVRGTVKRFDSGKGWGFIASGNDSLFVHRTDIQMDGSRTLEPGQEVECTPVQTDKGLKATNVVVVSDEPYRR